MSTLSQGLSQYMVMTTVLLCFIVGTLIKNLKFIPNDWIPILLAGVAIAYTAWGSGFTQTSVIQALCSSFAASGIYELNKSSYVSKLFGNAGTVYVSSDDGDDEVASVGSSVKDSDESVTVGE